ncbi:MAG: DNA polymerase III subunit gamma and tau, partial [Actinomycetota bacterium]|nr:DNA polymerase III subunit gamma and tau [Actinomycetota bacterium]
MTTALYRRYRPETFAEVIGQEHVTEPLMQALRTDRVNHAYLFSGPRGCGKTTSARILARCLNCEKGPTPVPCGVCDSCVALARGGAGTIDVIEIDAASHGGVDDARDLREKASFGPASSRFKIYIIDEAHMVTTQGFNALLKIVEEPPRHVKFIFATTEPEKVIGTIRSRTHHYPFRLVPPATVQDYLAKVCTEEGAEVGKGVLPLVVRAGAGSMRDSLSVLDQLIAGSGPEGLTYTHAIALLGYTDGALLDDVIDAFAAGDAATVFRVIDRVVESGHDPRRFVEDLLERLRDLIVVAAVPDGAHAILRLLPEDQLDRMRAQAAHFGAAGLSRAADITNTALTEMTGATSPRLQLELICARILLPGADGESGYAARLDRIERRLTVGGAPPVAPPAAPQSAAQPPQSVPEVSEPGDASGPPRSDGSAGEAPVAAPAQAPEPVAGVGAVDVEAIRRMWPDVLTRVYQQRRATWTFVSEHAQVIDYDGKRLRLAISTDGLLATFRRGPHAELVRQALIDVLGVDAQVEGIRLEGSGPSRPSAGPADEPRRPEVSPDDRAAAAARSWDAPPPDPSEPPDPPEPPDDDAPDPALAP